MADAIRRAIKKIRHKHKKMDAPRISQRQAEAKYDILLSESWQRDKKFQRDLSFKKALVALDKWRKERAKLKEQEKKK
jgi:hypothetical protein